MNKTETECYSDLYSTDLKHLERNLTNFIKSKRQSSLSKRGIKK